MQKIIDFLFWGLGSFSAVVVAFIIITDVSRSTEIKPLNKYKIVSHNLKLETEIKLKDTTIKIQHKGKDTYYVIEYLKYEDTIFLNLDSTYYTSIVDSLTFYSTK